MFYVISGFCLYHPYAREAFEGGRGQTLARYVRRRVLKIVPSYYLCLALVMCLPAKPGVHAAGESGVFEPVRQLLAHALFVHTWSADTSTAVNSVFWSLGPEVEFYVMFPLLARLLTARPFLFAALIWPVATLSRLAVERVATPDSLIVLAYHVPTYLDVFGAGMVAAYAVSRVRSLRSAGSPARVDLWTAAALLSSIACVALLQRFSHGAVAGAADVQWGLRYDGDAGLLFAVAITASCLAGTVWRRFAGNALLRGLSKISYNLYLWHAVCAVTVLTSTGLPWRSGIPGALCATALTLAVAYATTRFVEQPLLREPLVFGRAARAGAPAESVS
jgi:peptidoglycan/LPS O-acetylase OafA/YrhL